MFKCDVTKKTSKSGEKLTKVVVQTRPKTYKELKPSLTEDGKVIRDNYGNPVLVEVVVGQGFETVKEINVSQEGLLILGKS